MDFGMGRSVSESRCVLPEKFGAELALVPAYRRTARRAMKQGIFVSAGAIYPGLYGIETGSSPILLRHYWCPEGDLNPHDHFGSADFKSAVSADFTIRAASLS